MEKTKNLIQAINQTYMYRDKKEEYIRKMRVFVSLEWKYKVEQWYKWDSKKNIKFSSYNIKEVNCYLTGYLDAL